MICLLILISLLFYWSAQLALNTATPFIAVSAGTMSISESGKDNTWLHPFEQTLQVGDLLIIQGVDVESLNASYPYSDIIVFHKPDDLNQKIIHRIMDKMEVNGTLYFFTKGDGNTQYKWPSKVDPAYYDQWYSNNNSLPQGAICQELIEGKVIMRIPWAGYVVLFMENIIGNSESGDFYATISALIIFIILLMTFFSLLRLKRNG